MRKRKNKLSPSPTVCTSSSGFRGDFFCYFMLKASAEEMLTETSPPQFKFYNRISFGSLFLSSLDQCTYSSPMLNSFLFSAHLSNTWLISEHHLGLSFDFRKPSLNFSVGMSALFSSLTVFVILVPIIICLSVPSVKDKFC